MSVYSMPGEIDAYLTDYNWAAALANFFPILIFLTVPAIGILWDNSKLIAIAQSLRQLSVGSQASGAGSGPNGRGDDETP